MPTQNEVIMEFIKDLFNTMLFNPFREWSGTLEKARAKFKPSMFKKDQHLFAPIVFIIALIWTIVMVGLAIGSMVTLFCSLLILYFILSRIFGINMTWEDVVVV